MPIKPENKARYPSDWPAIRERILARADNRCEQCKVPNRTRIARGQGDDAGTYMNNDAEVFDAETGEHLGQCRMSDYDVDRMVDIVLTIAHLGLPAQLPVHLHVTRTAEADEVFQVVCFFVPLDPEVPEWRRMMHGRTLAQLSRGPAAVSTRFLVTLPSGITGSDPRGAVVHEAATMPPQSILLTDWCLLRKPLETAVVGAETPASAEIEAARLIARTAALALGLPESTFGLAEALVATGTRASDLVVRGLLRGQNESLATDDAISVLLGFSGSGHGASLYHFDDMPENCADDNLRALCQRCHLAYDAKHHATNARATIRSRKAIGDLFATPPENGHDQ